MMNGFPKNKGHLKSRKFLKIINELFLTVLKITDFTFDFTYEILHYLEINPHIYYA